MTETLEHGILIGRLLGGVCTLIKNSIVSNAEILLCFDRSAIVRIGLLAFINVYLPCTSKQSLVLIEEILAEIGVIIVKNPNILFFFGGDLNTNVHDSTRASLMMQKFYQSYNLCLSDDHLVAKNV